MKPNLTLLQDNVVEWVAGSFLPEQVFSEAVLEDWARRNGFNQGQELSYWRELRNDEYPKKGDLILFVNARSNLEIVDSCPSTVYTYKSVNKNIDKILRKEEV